MRPEKLLARIEAGYVANVRFRDFVRLLRALGFLESRVKGSHRCFAHRAAKADLVVQPIGAYAKGYQLRQLLDLISEYNLKLR